MSECIVLWVKNIYIYILSKISGQQPTQLLWGPSHTERLSCKNMLYAICFVATRGPTKPSGWIEVSNQAAWTSLVPLFMQDRWPRHQENTKELTKSSKGWSPKSSTSTSSPQKGTPLQMYRRYCTPPKKKHKETHKTCAILSHGELWVSNPMLKFCLDATKHDSEYLAYGFMAPNNSCAISWCPHGSHGQLHSEAHQVWRNHQETHPIHPGEVTCFVSTCFTCFPSLDSTSTKRSHETKYSRQRILPQKNQWNWKWLGKDKTSQSDDFTVESLISRTFGTN